MITRSYSANINKRKTKENVGLLLSREIKLYAENEENLDVLGFFYINFHH